jgi:hypothetical protein
MAMCKFISESNRKDEERKRIDSELLADVLGGLEIFLDKHNKTLASKDKAQWVAALYEQLAMRRNSCQRLLNKSAFTACGKNGMKERYTKKWRFIMTLQEKTDLMLKSIELEKAGRIEEADRLMKTVPVPPYLAKAAKESFGADALVATGHNLSEAEEAYGKDWLTK